MKKVRTDRISEEIKRELAQIVPGRIKDPRVTGLVSITAVEVTNDLSYAKVYVTRYGNQTQEEKDSLLKGLEKASGFIRGELGKNIKIRHVPQLLFTLDTSLEYGAKIDSLINKVKEPKDESNNGHSEDN
ncbi:ribosome-binding factor A [Desulfonispora thiosulfatigenes DSM 11270]|uniref:Ribosome-binding factor A n=1 Tax=Desulfonispora thiosulfatigenes DSM 11270 TaxID=656914 RepID=A0A1W1VL33_DESTI|nr:30S ribosome-binding factor RbfA [Desulfonispora thiosulfatigenes]SMB94095.1 ribosome-binding factor A [Desulfonispora thiosulfatigenes DSM 11270]